MAETNAQRLRPVRAGTWADVERAEGVFINILLRLPAQSIWPFRTVSKHWYGSIRNRFLAKQLLTKSREKPCFVACPRLVDRRMRLYSMKPGSFSKSHLRTFDPADRNDQDHMYMISSFNGLICCINHISDNDDLENDMWDLQIRIINPCTGETLLLPQGTPSFQFEPSVGVAYGSGDNTDYKVFRIFCAGKKIPEERLANTFYYEDGQVFLRQNYALAYECELYSSRVGVWVNIGPVPCVPMYSHLSPFRSCHVFVGGRIYWLSSLDDLGAILSVDFEGRFEVIQLPPYGDDQKEEDGITEATYLINLDGSLSVVILHPRCMDVWIWKQNSENSSWEPVCEDILTPFREDDLVLAISSLKNHILCMTQRKWCSYNVDTRRWKKRKTSRFERPTVFPFTESLLPCNCSGE